MCLEDVNKSLIDENGKKRRFAHVDGNWPSLIYIPSILLLL